MRLLISFARRYPKQCLIVFACLVLAGVAEGFGLSTLLPLLSLATNEGAAADPSPAERMLIGVFGAFGAEPSLAAMLVIIVLGMTLKAGLTLLTYRQVGYTVAHMATDLRLSLLAALSASRWEYFTRQRAGGMANAVATEATKSAQGFYEGAVMIALCIQSLVYLVVALLVNWQAALAASGVGVGIFFVLRALVRMARRAGVRQQRYFRSLLARLTDSLQSVKPLKSMARETQMDRLLEHDTRKLNKALRKEVFSAEALKAAQDLLVTLALVAGIYVLLVQWGMALSAVMVLTLVLARMLSSLGNIQKRYQKLAVSEAFYWSLRASIEEAEAQREHGGGEQRPTLDTGIRLRGVRFGYGARPVLDGIDLEIPAGRFTALIGSSGSGKTTLVDLVVGLLRPSAGEIRIDEAPFGRLDLRRWRRMIGYVPQDTVLLHDDVLNNVTLGDPELSEADAVSALKQADAWEFVRSLEDGIHTVVGERGGRLSGGQRQRVLIARALAHRPKLLILDEATSALDPDTEQSIARTLARLRGELTLLAVSHQSALTQAADVVYRIDNGKAVRLSEPPARPVAAS